MLHELQEKFDSEASMEQILLQNPRNRGE